VAGDDNLSVPDAGTPITHISGVLRVPDHPIVPFIDGAGVGRVAVRVLDQAVERAYLGQRRIHWLEASASNEPGVPSFGPDTLEAARRHFVTLVAPATYAPSPAAVLAHELGLTVNVRPLRWFAGVPAPVLHPERIDVTVFRTQDEDLPTAREQKAGGERLMRAAIDFALTHRRSSIAIVHQGNLPRHREHAFRNGCYEMAEREYAGRIYSRRQWERTRKASDEATAGSEQEQALAAGRVFVRDVCAEAALLQLLLDPESFDLIVATSVTGAHVAAVLSAQVGGLALAPSACIHPETGHAAFASAEDNLPAHAAADSGNPTAMILAGDMLLRHLGWQEAADLMVAALARTFADKILTGDFARQIEGATKVGASEFADHLIQRL
jgi:isocitrate dehydrogenase